MMARQSISVTAPNDEWLMEQVESKEYTSKSELINDLIMQARKQQEEINWVRTRLKQAEQRGFSNHSPEEILSIARNRK